MLSQGLFYFDIHNNLSQFFIFPILQLRKMRLKSVNYFAKDKKDLKNLVMFD